MQRYPLGRFSVTRIGLGAMQLPGPGVFGPPRDRDEALAVLRRAVELGADHIDTAQYYGPAVANELIRTALSPYPDSLALVSKVGARRDGSGGWLPYDDPDQLRRADELVGDVGPVVLRRVDVVDAQLDGPAQHRQGRVAVPRWAEHARAGQLHRAEADPRHREPAQRVTLHGPILGSRYREGVSHA